MKAAYRLIALVILLGVMLQAATPALQLQDSTKEASGTLDVLNAVLSSRPQQETSLILITETKSLFNGVGAIKASLGVGVFEVTTEVQDLNATVSHIGGLVAKLQKLREASMSVTVAVVSDDPAFLTTTTEWSLKGRLLVWSTRFLIITQLPLNLIRHLRNTLAMTNSMLILLTTTSTLRGSVYVVLPYGGDDAPFLQVGSWTIQRGLVLTSHVQFYPNKFDKLSSGPRLKVTYIEFPSTKKMVVADPEAPGGKRVVIMDPEVTLFEAIAKNMNFTFQPKTPADEAWGVEMANGSFTGMMGMLQRKDVDLSLSLFQTTAQRARVADFAYPLIIWYSRIMVHRGQPEIDPWGFLLPMAPLVWLAILTSLLGVVVVMGLLHFGLKRKETDLMRLEINAASYLRVLLHQDVIEAKGWWWWERVMVGMWMLMMLVLTQSYAGTLMSILAVRYIPLPIQSLEDIVDNPITLLLPRGTNLAQAFLDADAGIMGEVGALQHTGRLATILNSQMASYLDSHVRRGTHVLITIDSRTVPMIAQDFSDKERCDFYQGREELLPMMAAFASPKDSPLLPPFSRNIMRVVESGIYYYWLKIYTPNYTSCLQPPKKVAIRTPLGINNIWGTLVVAAGGGLVSLFVFCMEQLYFRITLYPTQS